MHLFIINSFRYSCFLLFNYDATRKLCGLNRLRRGAYVSLKAPQLNLLHFDYNNNNRNLSAYIDIYYRITLFIMVLSEIGGFTSKLIRARYARRPQRIIFRTRHIIVVAFFCFTRIISCNQKKLHTFILLYLLIY